ncbi:MAG: ABC transporter ATP-binding protein [Candidatus Tectimicrobiota bacterium]|nr:MAG: ABC transporter ATP-binding protein [Candidatus Tectomicrobia bacterium]
MLLRVDNLSVAYGAIRAVQGISFGVERGEIVCIIGANGAGKSSTLRAISRLVPVGTGTRLWFDGHDLTRYPPHRVVRELGISHVPEGRRVFGNLTVMENLLLATFGRRDKAAVARDLAMVFDLFPRLAERRQQKAGTLSGGEQQMLAVGRALVSGRRLMLLDEPSMGLAPLLMQELFKALEAINREGTTILLVEQNAHLALHFARRGYVLETGRLVLEGPTAALLANPQVKEAYLGG